MPHGTIAEITYFPKSNTAILEGARNKIEIDIMKKTEDQAVSQVSFNGPYRPYGRRTAAAKSGHVFQQSVWYGCLSTDFEVGCVGFLPVYFKHGKRGRDK
jgi:hypothetical protein